MQIMVVDGISTASGTDGVLRNDDAADIYGTRVFSESADEGEVNQW